MVMQMDEWLYRWMNKWLYRWRNGYIDGEMVI